MIMKMMIITSTTINNIVIIVITIIIIVVVFLFVITIIIVILILRVVYLQLVCIHTGSGDMFDVVPKTSALCAYSGCLQPWTPP